MYPPGLCGRRLTARTCRYDMFDDCVDGSWPKLIGAAPRFSHYQRILGIATGAGVLIGGLWCALLVDEVAGLVAAGDAELGIGAVQV
jgi:hypothetical protein